jgi:hypothetical protein
MRIALLTGLAALALACGHSHQKVTTPPDLGGGPGSDGGVAPFEPVGPQTYVPKVKNLLTGLAATDAEVQAVVKDPTALRGLIDQWMALPEFQGKMLDFFRNAFQQNQVTMTTLSENVGLNTLVTAFNPDYRARFERSLMDSFALTVWQLVSNGHPLTDALSTQQYMMTTAMLSVLSYVDDMNVDDLSKRTDRLSARNALTQFIFDPKSTVALADTLNPASPNYMTWAFPVTIPATCTTPTPVTYPAKGNYDKLFGLIFGYLPYAPCYPMGTQKFTPQLADSDWSDWRLVTIHPTDATTPNATPSFWDLLKLRAATDITLKTPRMGFFGTLAFAANWGTNASNEARVTANQSLIVALGLSINPSTGIVKFPVTATDSAHATDPACAGCHSMLDPYKQFFRQSWTLFYHDQTDATQGALPANFNIDGVTMTGSGIGDLVKIYAAHPRFPIAWTQKLQYWANSTAADESDPEMVRIAAAFQQSGFDWKTLVRELFSSPLVTLASATQTTTENGVILSIARRDQYCAAISNRLGLADACGQATAKPSAAQTTLSTRANLLPVDGYFRAYELPALPTDPDLFFRATTESMCQLVAAQVIDAGTASRYSSMQPATAIADFVATVMNLTASDPRAAQAQQILTDHFNAARTAGASAADALKSTFTLACIAPSSVIVGL